MPSLPQFTPPQQQRLALAFHAGAVTASDAIARWLSVPALISIDSVDECSVEDAAQSLGATEEVCLCAMRMEGSLSGQMVLGFDDASGWALADLALGHPADTSRAWGDLELSAALESMNILGSAYLNGMAGSLSQSTNTAVSLLPSPPVFLRDFAESLLESAFLDQAAAGSRLLFARARFEIRGRPFNWMFLLIPDPPSFARLAELLN